MNMAKIVIGGLAVLGIGATGYRAYKLKKANDEVKHENVIEIAVESKEETRK